MRTPRQRRSTQKWEKPTNGRPRIIWRILTPSNQKTRGGPASPIRLEVRSISARMFPKNLRGEDLN